MIIKIELTTDVDPNHIDWALVGDVVAMTVDGDTNTYRDDEITIESSVFGRAEAEGR